ncbi:FadR/GntR family transcriptional regulator [Amycolatopsis sp. 195334CR]|uniref:FadR/GntR family transcriptional regulator n=1 Tax=Amycolatopsis sp. 195334CR TaxID=2814588 RepID=UPI001A8E5549|nr:FadR/GntR family transcriptional regulator [Amycolatopsis sp. 195334CR]MBN6038260.1 FadR family transcriptional regulator [Amycolatopsis sp. 195334CR]
MTASLALGVVDGLKARIVSGDLSPGARLPSEKELIDTYGVSRSTAREAVTRLQAEGLVETHQGRGSFVLAVPEATPFRLDSGELRHHSDVLAMLDFRIGVESEAAALAATRVGARSAKAIEKARAAFASAGADTVVEADFAFHRAIAAASGNRFYLELLDALGPMMIMLPRSGLGDAYSLTDSAHVDRVRSEHDNIAAAIQAGDAETARAALRVHLGNTRRRLQADTSP